MRLFARQLRFPMRQGANGSSLGDSVSQPAHAVERVPCRLTNSFRSRDAHPLQSNWQVAGPKRFPGCRGSGEIGKQISQCHGPQLFARIVQC